MVKWLLVVALAVMGASLGACGGQQVRTTRIAAEDFADVAAAVAAQLQASDALHDRGPDDEPWVIAIDRVQNLSSDVISLSEQWWLMAKLRSSLPMRTLSTERAVKFVIPAEHLEAVRARDPELGEAAVERAPTHRMGAVFRSVTRVGQNGRTDLYQVDFDLVSLGDGQLEWSGSYEFKRLAFGRGWD
ncbi:MAG: hypothetical protein DYG94_10660 [Leptolyngbya sp. PLA3]|nr:MAG: hypothetical protein EDM82_09225 [Cyanobacteria bacterium CYA]MCE7969193.1 hypothetical protein [Leptolyngbya sp. PL-A3]